MEFRLIYRGPLHGNGSTREKQRIREIFHQQLKELWQQGPLKDYQELLNPTPTGGQMSLVCPLGDFQFVPLVSKRVNLVCHLDILFLRRAEPGMLIGHGGDIDNRLKTLFDALRMPKTISEISKDKPADGETLFYCLLEDDALITQVAVTTDRLLEPALPESETMSAS